MSPQRRRLAHSPARTRALRDLLITEAHHTPRGPTGVGVERFGPKGLVFSNPRRRRSGSMPAIDRGRPIAPLRSMSNARRPWIQEQRKLWRGSRPLRETGKGYPQQLCSSSLGTRRRTPVGSRAPLSRTQQHRSPSRPRRGGPTTQKPVSRRERREKKGNSGRGEKWNFQSRTIQHLRPNPEAFRGAAARKCQFDLHQDDHRPRLRRHGAVSIKKKRRTDGPEKQQRGQNT